MRHIPHLLLTNAFSISFIQEFLKALFFRYLHARYSLHFSFSLTNSSFVTARSPAFIACERLLRHSLSYQRGPLVLRVPCVLLTRHDLLQACSMYELTAAATVLVHLRSARVSSIFLWWFIDNSSHSANLICDSSFLVHWYFHWVSQFKHFLDWSVSSILHVNAKARGRWSDSGTFLPTSNSCIISNISGEPII